MLAPDKMSHLLLSKEEKINTLSEKNYSSNNLDRSSYTDLGDGYVENNGNKIWGISDNWTPEENAFARDYLFENFGLPTEANADRRAYQYGVKEEGKYIDPTQPFQPTNYDPVKVGLASGRLPSSDYRYTPGKAEAEGLSNRPYGWESGERGVDVNDKRFDQNLAYGAATALESLTHSNKNNIENRLVRERADGYYDYMSPEGLVVIDKAEKDQLFGSGASEYYVNNQAIFADSYDPTQIDQQKVIAGINKAMQTVAGDKYEVSTPSAEQEAEAGRLADEYTSFTDRAANTAKGFAATFVDSLIVAPAAAIGDLTGAYDLGSGEENTAAVNKFFGYDPRFNQRAMERIGTQWSVVADESASIPDRVRAAGTGIIEAFTTPETLGTSLGALASWVTPGTLLKAVGVGSKFANSMKAIDAAVDAGTITANAARLQKASQFLSVPGAQAALTAQSGFLVSALGNVNNQYQEFVKNNDGVELEGAEKAQWFAGRYAVQVVNQNIDKLVDFSILKGSPGLIAGAIPAVKAMTNKEFANVAKTMAKGVAVTGTNMGKEAAQEYSQTMMELFNSRYGSKKFEDVDSFVDFITDERNTTEAGIAALAGAGGAGQFETVGSVATAAGKLASMSARRTPAPTEADPESAEAQQERDNIVAENLRRATAPAADTATAEEDTPAPQSNPLASFYGAQGSFNDEAKAAASATAKQTESQILDGTHEVFQSDADLSTKLTQLDPLIEMVVAENPEVSNVELVRAVAKAFKATPEQVAEIEQTVEKAYNAGQEFASIKPMLEVSGEVSEGPKGFITYYTAAKAALAEGNEQEYNTYIGKLDYFYNYQKSKAERIQAGIDQARSDIATEADALVQAGKAANTKEAFKLVRAKYKASENPGGVTIAYSDNPNSGSIVARYDHVADQMVNPNSKPFAIFKVLSGVKNEIAGMDRAYSLLTNSSETAANTETAAPTTTRVEPTSNNTVVPPAAPKAARGVTAPSAPVPPPIVTVVNNDGSTTELPPAVRQEEDFVMEQEDIVAPSSGPAVNPNEDFTVPSEQLDAPVVSDEELASYEDYYMGQDMEDDTSIDMYDNYEVASYDGDVTPTATKADVVAQFAEDKRKLKELNKNLKDRRNELGLQGYVKEDIDQDLLVTALVDAKDALTKRIENAPNTLADHVETRKAGYKQRVDMPFKLFDKWVNNTLVESVQTTIKELYSNLRPSGFTLFDRTLNDAQGTTKEFIENLEKNLTDGSARKTDHLKGLENNPSAVLLYNIDGTYNVNTVEAMQGAAYEYLVQDMRNLIGADRTIDEVAELFNISADQVTPDLYDLLSDGGVTLRMAAEGIGSKVYNNLGLNIDSIDAKNAMITSLGMVALQGMKGDLVDIYRYSGSELRGNPVIIKGTPAIFGKLKKIKGTINYFEETLGVEIDNVRSYRRTATSGNRKVLIHRAEFQEAPKDHSDAVNRLEKTGFKPNDGVAVLAEMFSDKDGALDANKLAKHILGPEVKGINYDDELSYAAKKEALMRDIRFYNEALADVGDGELFFDWFIARNHRIHLDSNTLNPQNDKNLARWLFTTTNSRVSINKSDIDAVLNGEATGNLEAVMFAYAIVQAFDGAKDVISVDKDNEAAVIANAKSLLQDTDADTLMSMAKEASHVGHAALALANIRKYKANDVINSDMVLEVDGLTNGFAFRALQYPVKSPNSPFTPTEWNEKIGFVSEGSEFYALESMNGARALGQEDVYISVGGVFGDKLVAARKTMKGKNKKWVEFFENGRGLPNFSDKNDESLKKFVRNLMKSPVMIFNYAAGASKIASGLVNDQILGKGYLSGKGLLGKLTEQKQNENKEIVYVITKQDLVNHFGKTLGETYHNARVALATKSYKDKSDPNIQTLMKDLRYAISNLYVEPITETLEELFSEQTVVNRAITDASMFMYEHFKAIYTDWKNANPKATEEDKIDFLKEKASILPGVKGANSDDQSNKITFLKSVLEESTNNVQLSLGANKIGTRTVERTFGQPGVAAAVLTVLGLDSSTLARTINLHGDKGFLPVHDAEVLGIGEHRGVSNYNQVFYDINRSYSIIDEFVNAVNGIRNASPEMEQIVITNKAGEPVTFYDMLAVLTNINDTVQRARAEIFSRNVKTGQMGGPNGTMVTINVKERKDAAITELGKMSETILNQFNNLTMQGTLGKKEHQVYLKRLQKMLEGCK